MNKCWIVVMICFVGVLVFQRSWANRPSEINKALYDKAEASLKRGDTLQACVIYKQLRKEADSIAQINYQNEVKVMRSTYEIDQLYLENKIQGGILLKRAILFLLITILLLAITMFYLRNRNQKLEQARIKAQQLKEEAEESIRSKSELLYAISQEMIGSLTEMKKITLNIQETDTISPEEVRADLSNLRTCAEKPRDVYNRIST